jgi:prepilin-type N-terminal cleavage/methylation domain-containing protein
MMKSEKGFSLAEVMVAVALLGVVSVSFLSAIGTAYRAVFIADEQASAENLARSEMEYVKSQEYSVAPWSYEIQVGESPSGEFPGWWEEHPSTLPAGYESYVVSVTAEALHDNDDGVQKIVVVVEREDDQLVILEGYRSVRL